MEVEQTSAISRLAGEKFWKLYIDTHFENRRETIIRDLKKSKENRDENVGRLIEVDDFIAFIEQNKQEYKENNEGKEKNGRD